MFLLQWIVAFMMLVECRDHWLVCLAQGTRPSFDGRLTGSLDTWRLKVLLVVYRLWIGELVSQWRFYNPS